MRISMRLATIVFLSFLAGFISASAQSAPGNAGVAGMENLGGQSPWATAAAAQKMGASCPISLRAEHAADGGITKVDKNRPEGVAQLLHLTLTSKDSRQIVEARLRVRGVSPKGRVSHADRAEGGANTMRNVQVRLRPDAENEVSGDAWVQGMSAVLEVELTAVTFADGGTTRFSAADGCRFMPDNLMLVGSK